MVPRDSKLAGRCSVLAPYLVREPHWGLGRLEGCEGALARLHGGHGGQPVAAGEVRQLRLRQSREAGAGGSPPVCQHHVGQGGAVASGEQVGGGGALLQPGLHTTTQLNR
jgi:hypothetical protein